MKARTTKERIIEKHQEALHQGFRAWPSLAFDRPAAMGDARWTADLILATWMQAETGHPPDNGLEYQVGGSNGGFDMLAFKFLPKEQWVPEQELIDTAIPLNRRPYDRKIQIPIPWYGAGMSYGSISEQIMLARAKVARQWNTFTSTGEGGYPESLAAYREHVITQVATGMFGVREETILWAPIVEFKYAQGAKPGLGGHLLGDKATMTVAKMRESVPWVSLFSPFKTTRNILTGLKPSIPRPSSRSRYRRLRTSIWWLLGAIMLERISSRSMGDTAARAQRLKLPRRTLQCRSS